MGGVGIRAKVFLCLNFEKRSPYPPPCIIGKVSHYPHSSNQRQTQASWPLSCVLNQTTSAPTILQPSQRTARADPHSSVILIPSTRPLTP